MKFLTFLLRQSSRSVLLAIFLGIISGACNTGLLAVINSALSAFESRSATLLAGFIALCLIVPIARSLSELVLIRLGQTVILDMRMQLCRKIVAAPLRQIEETGGPKLLAALTEDVLVVTNGLVFVPILCINIAIVIGCLIYLGWLYMPALAAMLGLMIVGIGCYSLALKRAVRFQRLAREIQDSLFKHFRALTDGIKELKLHRARRAAFLDHVLGSTTESFRQNNVAAMTHTSVAASFGQMLFFVFIGTLLFASTQVSGINQQSLQGYVLALLFIMTPLQVILNTIPVLARADISVRKIEELGLSLSKEETARPMSRPSGSTGDWSCVEMVGVRHSYFRERENSSFVLGPIDLTLKPGEMVFLIGGNGSGKTTLAKLLVGLYAPESGEIRLDGKPVTSYTMEFYREKFSAVFSDFFLFENMLGLDGPQLDSQAQKYLSQLQLEHKVQVKDGVLSTTGLSQGQRKRLALLTAYLEDRPIYLFDEWAADQDPLFKEIFYYYLLPELKSRGKTIVVISHDDRYYHVADRIIKLDYGKLEYDQYLSSFQTSDPVLSKAFTK